MEAVWPGALFVLLAGLYVATMPPHATLEDSGAFITIAHHAGIAHPPGYPLYTMLGKLFSLLPVGTVAFRVQLISAIAGALACVALYHCCLGLSQRRAAAFFAALFCGVSGLFWRQSLIAEVYALHALFMFLLLHLALRVYLRFRPRDLYWFAFAYGLGLSHHWPLLVLGSAMFAPLLAAALAARRPSLKACLAMAPRLAGLVLAGLSPYLYLVIRSSFDPFIAAFGPVGLADLVPYVLRQRYAGIDVSVTATAHDSLRYLLYFLREWAREMGVVSTLGVCAGMVWAGLRERRIIVGALFAGFLASSVLLLVFLRTDYDLLRRDVYMQYQAVPFGVSAIFLHYCLVATQGLAARGLAPGRLRDALPALAGVLFCAATLAGNAGRSDLRANTYAYDYARAVLEGLPTGAALFLYGDQDVGPLSYARFVAAVRDDVRLYSQHGHLFGNHIVHAGDRDQRKARETLLKFLERENGNRLFVIRPSKLFRSLARHGAHLHDHGHLYELSLSERRTALKFPVDAARAFLERHWPDAYGHLWTYHRQRLTGALCRPLILRNESHPILERHDYCKVLLAKRLAARKENQRAAGLLREFLHAGIPWVKRGLVNVYVDYFRAQIAVIHAKPPGDASKLSDYQRLVDDLYPAAQLRPTCDNAVARTLLEIGAQVPVNIRLDALKKTYGHCDDLLPLFARARRAQR